MPVVDGHTDGRTDRTEFIGPLSALPGIQKLSDYCDGNASHFQVNKNYTAANKISIFVNSIFEVTDASSTGCQPQ